MSARRVGLAVGLLVVGACAPARSGSIDGPTAAAGTETRARATAELENLEAFAHLYGYVRFFHPTDAAAEAPWSVLAAQGVHYVRDADSLDELDERLHDLFEPLAPTLQIWVDGESAPPPPEPPGPRDALVYWQHQGFLGSPVSLYRPPYQQVRVGADERSRRRFVEAPAHDARIEAELLADLEIRLPLVLDAEQLLDDGDTQPPRLDSELDELATAHDGWSSIDVRQGAVIEVWNVLRHFYPYQSAVERDWNALLREALVDAQDDRTREDTVQTLGRMVHAIQDGHGEVGHTRASRGAALPFRLELVQGRGVVTATAAPDQFAIGDIVEQIDGEPVLERIERIDARLSGSERWRQFKAATWEAVRGPDDVSAQIVVQRGEASATVTSRYAHDEPVGPARPPNIHRYADGVFYVDLTRTEWSEIEPRLEELATAPGIVFDMRGYPRHNHPLIDHLLTEPEDALWMHVPRFVEPGGRPVAWHDIGWHRRPAEPRIAGKVAFLISAGAISYAESILGYVEAHDLGTLVGSPTAGTNGDIVRIDTLSELYVVFTGMRVTRHDQSPFHLQGVQPHVEVEPTLAGLRAGRDEVLEAGLAVARADLPDDPSAR